MREIISGQKGRGLFYSRLPASAAAAADSPVEKRLLSEYGAVFVAGGGAIPPDRIIFRNESEVSEFQNTLDTSRHTIGDFEMELQSAAMEDLIKAIAEAAYEGVVISPRGPDSARRSFDETVGLWNSRVLPALDYWAAQGRLSADARDGISSMSTFEQVAEVLRLEEEGIFFAKDLSKSILYSVAPPGASQHLALLAFDVAEFGDTRAREILASNRWFQTVVSDLPHFTYLGVEEDRLPDLGLKRVFSGEQSFWVPDIPASHSD